MAAPAAPNHSHAEHAHRTHARRRYHALWFLRLSRWFAALHVTPTGYLLGVATGLLIALVLN